MDTAALRAWVQDGRKRAAAGQWEGTAPGVEFEQFMKKAASTGLTTNDLQRLVALLGAPGPADREGAAKILAAQREQALPTLIEAVEDPLLGVRIGAGEFLERLVPDIVSIDPWQAPGDLSNTVVRLRKWWSETGVLPAPSSAPAVSASVESSLHADLEALRGDDPVRRTEAMAGLVGQGKAALPAVHEAIKRAERVNDQRAIGLLEDVRWAIVVPDALEARTGSVRQTLARGKSSERQSAAERLGRAGGQALGALIELVNDPDPLVVESAVRALSALGGDDAIPSMAALLQANENNVRMTAAQALGHTKSAAAMKPLLTVLDDPNEIVACTALAAVEEIRSEGDYGTSKQPLNPDVTAAFKRCLTDARWRVRAAAAEVVGKTECAELTEDLKAMLVDADAFVVKSALDALGKLNVSPDLEQLTALANRLPSLRGNAVEAMLASKRDEVPTLLTGMFNTSGADDQLAILNVLARVGLGSAKKTDDRWHGLLQRATTATDGRLRRAAASVLGLCSPDCAAAFVGPLLDDDDPETRSTAADVVVSLLGAAAGFPPMFAASSGGSFYEAALIGEGGHPSGEAEQAPQFLTPERVSAWHMALLRHAGKEPGFGVATAVVVTGDGKGDLPLLVDAVKRMDTSRRRLNAELVSMGLVLKNLSWPEGRSFIDALAGSPLGYAMAVRHAGLQSTPMAEYIMEPARFAHAIESAQGDALSGALGLLAGYEYDYGGRRSWSLWAPDDRAQAIARELIQSSNAAWRAAGLYSLALRARRRRTRSCFSRRWPIRTFGCEPARSRRSPGPSRIERASWRAWGRWWRIRIGA